MALIEDEHVIQAFSAQDHAQRSAIEFACGDLNGVRIWANSSERLSLPKTSSGVA
jgi:hypothetical protein